ncbi:MAG: hypothetical protein IPJ34_06810 [Myxococcales bacterium]|nr:hypothetical protein [Myxococcales bacterium]
MPGSVAVDATTGTITGGATTGAAATGAAATGAAATGAAATGAATTGAAAGACGLSPIVIIVLAGLFRASALAADTAGEDEGGGTLCLLALGAGWMVICASSGALLTT